MTVALGEVPIGTRKAAWKAIGRLFDILEFDRPSRPKLFFVHPETYREWEKGECFPNNDEVLTRVSDYLKFYGALRGILCDKDILHWMNAPNNGLLFKGVSPINLLRNGDEGTLKSLYDYLNSEKNGT